MKRIALSLIAPPLVTAVICATNACTVGARPKTAHPQATAAGGVLNTMGFALTDDGDPSTQAGTLSATFNAPVIGNDGELDQPGTAHAIFDDGEKDLSSAAIVNAFPDSDVVYAVMFDENEPWRYVLVAAHAPDLVAGADVALDGSNAAALVVDENTGSGFLSQAGGSLHVDSADLSVGGTLAGSLSTGLVEVGLDTWPESLFPFTSSGDPATQANGTGTGTFNAIYSADGSSAPGTAAITVSVDGFPDFTGTVATVQPVDDNDSAILISDDSDRQLFAIFLDNASFAAGTISLSGYAAGAELLEEDGTTIAFTAGSLTLTDVTLSEGGAVTGSFSVDGSAYVIPADQGGGGTVSCGTDADCGPGGVCINAECGYAGEGEGEDCTGIDTLASTFAPAQVYIQTATPDDQMPAGYDRVLTFTDATNGMLGLIVSTDVDFHAGTPYSFSTVDFQGSSFPAAVLGLATCSQPDSIDSGTLTATVDDAGTTMTGTLSYTIAGSERDLSFAAAVISQ